MLLITATAHAQNFPIRPVTLAVPFPPGGGTDTGARLIAQTLSAKWGQQVVVDNKGGAAGQIGADLVAKAKPDGYAILMGNIGTQAIDPSLHPKLPYDPDKAFAPISLVAELPLAMMVNPNVAAKTAQEFVLLARSKPGHLSDSSSGAGARRTWRRRCSSKAATPSSCTCPTPVVARPFLICWPATFSCPS